jgi:hypothetical protein
MDNFSEISRCSSLDEVLMNDTHDPNLSRLAKNMFQKTSDYLNFEVRLKHGFLIISSNEKLPLHAPT